jgi:hypothetical protein
MAYQNIDIPALYQELFGRPSDQDGQAFWDGKNYDDPIKLRRDMAAGAAPADFNAFLAGNAAQSDPVTKYYRELFGRDPDQEGYQYWTGKIDQFGTGNPLREAIIATAAPTDAAYYGNRNTSEADWAAYRQRAAQQDQGINNMPFVVSDYGAYAGKTPEEAMALLYRQPFGGLGGLGGNQTDPNTQGR